jgi:hypothetical protein
MVTRCDEDVSSSLSKNNQIRITRTKKGFASVGGRDKVSKKLNI